MCRHVGGLVGEYPKACQHAVQEGKVCEDPSRPRAEITARHGWGHVRALWFMEGRDRHNLLTYMLEHSLWSWDLVDYLFSFVPFLFHGTDTWVRNVD